MKLKETLTSLFEYKTLSREQAFLVLMNIAKGELNNSQIACFLTVFLMRAVTVEELEGFREALLELCLPVDLSGFDAVDLCGTGGDGKYTFNISTLASFVVAASGIKVAKHGNYGVSSVSGSSNVMEYLGYKFTNDQDILKRQMDNSGICFMHAPLFHPALRTVAPVRKELGVKTFFNMLGPLVNPARPKYQTTGVFNLEMLRIYKYILEKNSGRFIVVHSLDGYDEISLTGDFKIVSRDREQLINPHDLGLIQRKPEELYGGNTVDDSAHLFRDILEGRGTGAQNEVVAANAGLAIYCVNSKRQLSECIQEALDLLKSKKALDVFKKLMKN